MSENSRRYRFPPHSTGGIVLGLTGGQLAGFVAAAAMAIMAMKAAPGLVGPLVVVVDVVVAWLIVVFRIAGHTCLEWLPIVARFLTAWVTGRLGWRSATTTGGMVVEIPSAVEVDPRAVTVPVSLPPELKGLEVLETRLQRFGNAPLGVVHDRKADTYTATLRCEPRAFYLLGEQERELMLGAYGQTLATFAQDGSPVRRVAWYERTLPASADELWTYLRENARPDITEDDVGLVATCQHLTAQQGARGDHEILFSLQIDARRSTAARSIKRLGGGQDGALALVAEQTSRLVSELTRIGVLHRQPVGVRNPAVPSARGLAAILRNGLDPFTRLERDRPPAGQPRGVSAERFGPTAREGGWSYARIDGTLSATGHLLEFPRSDVRASFLQGLLMGCHNTTRTVAVVMDVLGPRKATRKAEGAAESAAAEGWLRQRVGRRTTARDRVREHAADSTEQELAVGHALVRFAAFVTVAVPERDGLAELDAEFERVQGVALTSGLRLERCWGEMIEAATFTLPLCRGVK